MKKLLAKFWAAVTAFPASYDDYVGVGRWLVYKKLFVVLGLLLAVAGSVLVWWMNRPDSFAIPTFYYFEDKLKVYSGEAVLVDEHMNTVYRGQISGGLCDGVGSQFDPQNALLVYDGGFSDNRYSGQGTLYQEGSKEYNGMFLNGLYSGDGELYAQSGALLYQGQFALGKYSGLGKLYQGGRLLYEGMFRDGKYAGTGTLYHSSNTVAYTGGFANGVYEGAGKLFTSQGAVVYEGQFCNGLYDGQGTLYAEGGVRLRFQGEFIQGTPGRSGKLYNERGVLLYEGAVYQGQADYIGLVGLPMAELQVCVKEVPNVYYGTGYAGYLYRELGFAVVIRYDDSDRQAAASPNSSGAATESGQPADSTASRPGIELFAPPTEGSTADLLIVEGTHFSGQFPLEGMEIAPESVPGMAALVEGKLAGVLDLPKFLGTDPKLAQRGAHLFEACSLPASVKMNGVGVCKGDVNYFYRKGTRDKGGETKAVYLEKVLKN